MYHGVDVTLVSFGGNVTNASKTKNNTAAMGKKRRNLSAVCSMTLQTTIMTSINKLLPTRNF